MGNAYLAAPNKSKSTTTNESRSFIYAISEMQGWRRTMEDAHIDVCELTPDTSIFGVFDGHGGRAVALFVKRHFIEELQMNKNFKDQKFEEALMDTFLRMDQLLFSPDGQKEIDLLREGEEIDCQPGCTANVALFHKNTLYVANAGDSRAVLCRNNTNYDMSVDHKPTDIEEKQRIERAGGFVQDGRVNGNLNLSRALGDLDYKGDKKLRQNEQLIIAVPDIKKVELTPNDKFLLMGCDGIFETGEHQELIKFINSKFENQSVTPQKLGKVAEDLLEHLIAPDTSLGIGCDNMTTIIIYLKGK